MTIQNLRDQYTAKLFKTILSKDNSPVMQLLNKVLKTKRFHRTYSALNRIVARQLTVNYPDWRCNPTVFSFVNLRICTKENTIAQIFSNEFSIIQDSLNSYSFTYTDGSKSNCITSFSIT